MTNYAKLTREQAQTLICSTAPDYKIADMMELLKDYEKAIYQDAFVPEYYSLIINCADGEIEFLYQADEWTGWIWDNLEILANIKKGKRLY